MKNKTKYITTDHTLIINKLEKSIEFYGWDLILSFLPEGSFLVGGYIRDILLDRINSSLDVDIVVPANAIEVGKKISNNFKVKSIVLDKDREVIRIIFNQISIDIANRIGLTIEEDLKTRDFSINAIAYSFNKKCLIDPLNGIKDIELFLLKSYSNKNLLNDPLRILRCFRFISELNFRTDDNLISFIQKNKGQLNIVAKERINYEVHRIIKGVNAIESINLLKKLNLFDLQDLYKDSFFVDIKQINYGELHDSESQQYLPLFFLSQLLDVFSLEKFRFSKSEILNIKLLRKWQSLLKIKKIYDFNEVERFNLHQELEHILPSFVFHLPKELHIKWLNRWRDKSDKLFHPANLIKGEVIKKYLNLEEGPLFGKLMNYLSIELAYKRLDNFDEAIFKAEQWIEQNAPKCD